MSAGVMVTVSEDDSNDSDENDCDSSYELSDQFGGGFMHF